MNFEITPKNFKSLIQGGESKWLEFKSIVPPDHAISKHLVAFANTEGGIVLFGIGDKGTVLGIPESNVAASLARLKRLASSLLPYPVDIGLLDHDGKTLIYIRVAAAPESDRPIMTAHGEIFTRHADRIHEDRIAEQMRTTGPNKPPKTSPKGRIEVFVAMSFREEEEPSLVDYYAAMRRACQQADQRLHLSRMDLVEGDHEISQKIMDEIDKAHIFIADFTLSPRNVYFELGYARGRKKMAIIQTARKETFLEFDVRNWRTLSYKNATELEAKLVTALQEALAKLPTMGS